MTSWRFGPVRCPDTPARLRWQTLDISDRKFWHLQTFCRDNTVFWGRPWDISTRTCSDKNLILARRQKISRRVFWGGRSRVVSRCLWWQKLDVSDETSGYTDSESLAYSLSLRSGNKLYFSLQTSCFIKTGVETIRTYRSSDETRPAGSRHLMNQSIVISYIWWRRRRRTDLLFSLLLENSQYFISHSGKLTHSFFFSRTHILMPLIVAWLICRRKYKITARRTGHTKVDNTKYFRFKPLNLQ